MICNESLYDKCLKYLLKDFLIEKICGLPFYLLLH